LNFTQMFRIVFFQNDLRIYLENVFI